MKPIPFYDLSPWIIDVCDARMSIFPANDDLSEMGTMAGDHPGVQEMFNPALPHEFIIMEQKKILRDVGAFLNLMALNLRDPENFSRIDLIADACEAMASTIRGPE